MTDGVYTLGETDEADDRWLEAQDALWTSAGFGGPAITDLLGLSQPHRVSGRRAIEQAAALICLDVLSQDISKATLRLKKKVKGGGEVDVEPGEHRIARMLALDPNERHTWTEFVGMAVFHLGLSSNSFAYVKRNRLDEATAIVPLMPARVQENINQRTGEVFYDIQASTVHEIALLGSDYITAPARNVLHIRQRMLDGFYGYSTLLAGGPTLSLNRDLIEYERNTYSGNPMSRGYFSRAGAPLDDDPFRRMQSQIKKLLQRRGPTEPIVLEDGIKYEKFALTAVESELPKALDKAVEMICKLWRMPPHKAMHLTAVKYENLTAMEMVYVRDTLIPLCRLIEGRLNRTLLTEEERLTYRFEFDRDEMAIADEKALAEEVIKLGERGFISHDEVREARRFNPKAGGKGKIYTLPANAKWVDEDNKTVATGAKDTPAPNSDGAPPADDEQPPAKGLRLVVNE